MKIIIIILALSVSVISFAQKQKTHVLKKKNHSESKNILMYAPNEGQHDFLFRLIVPTGSISGTNIDIKYSGFFSGIEYGYGVNDSLSFGFYQSLLGDYTILGNNSDSKYKGIGDTALISKYILPIENLIFYFSGQYRMALLAKSKNDNDSKELELTQI